MKTLFKIAVSMCVLTSASTISQAQMDAPSPTPAYQPLAYDQLQELLGPIALYPDPLIAQILPASTFPAQVVLADRYVNGSGDPSLIDQQPWDASVRALARYPEILKWMDDNLDWTTQLGQAFLNQQQDVMDAIQWLRRSAYNLGNLRSTPQQQVINNGGYIEILPVNTQVIYVPVYQPAVVFYQTVRVPVITFRVGCAIGWWLNCDFDWANHHIIVWHRSHPRPANWWHEPLRQRTLAHTTIWRRENHPNHFRTYHSDRGWGVSRNQPVKKPVVAVVGHSVSDSVMPRKQPAPAARPKPSATRTITAFPVQRIGSPFTPPRPLPGVNRNPVQRESNGAFIGVQNSRETRDYSNRGRQSTRTMTGSKQAPHTMTGPRSAPTKQPAQSTGGNRGNRADFQQKR